tara:strand:+ start:354 stop:530 length:177 start_codon:yes stop_codon:yes gene_type:complete
MTTNFRLPHYIDEENAIVYIAVKNWSQAMLATHGGAKHFGSRYQIKLANEDYLKELKK